MSEKEIYQLIESLALCVQLCLERIAEIEERFGTVEQAGAMIEKYLKDEKIH